MNDKDAARWKKCLKLGRFPRQVTYHNIWPPAGPGERRWQMFDEYPKATAREAIDAVSLKDRRDDR